jgi:hypothetical protein
MLTSLGLAQIMSFFTGGFVALRGMDGRLEIKDGRIVDANITANVILHTVKFWA